MIATLNKWVIGPLWVLVAGSVLVVFYVCALTIEGVIWRVGQLWKRSRSAQR